MHHLDRTLCSLALLVVAGRAAGQCDLQWQAGDPIPFVHGNTRTSTTWDPDGAGPQQPLLVVGGRFRVGSMFETSLAAFDGTSWSPLGAPPIPDVRALVVWNGLLVAAGGLGNQHSVAAWNGSSWSLLGSTNGPVNAMAVFQNNLVVGGFFSTMNGVFLHNIAQWNGIGWAEPGGGVTGEVSAMTVFGSLFVGGTLTQAGGIPVGNLASWSGSAWSAGPICNARVRCLSARNGATTASSFLFVGGDFSSIAGVAANHIARFSASTGTWSALPGLPGTSCRALHVRSTGLTTFQLHAAVEGVNVLDKVWRLNGAAWATLGAVVDESELLPTSLAFFGTQYVVTFETQAVATSALRQAVRVHDGTAWQGATGPGFDARIRAVTALGSELVVAGDFRHYGTSSLECIARGSPGNWQPLGSGIGNGIVGSRVHAVCALANGDLVAGGAFTVAGGTSVANVARWDGSAWSPLGLGCNGRVEALLPLPNGELIVGGSFTIAGGIVVNHIARWSGTTWSALGSGTDARVAAMCRLSNGDIVATGAFTAAGGVPASRIARWNGASWLPLGTGLDDAGAALVALPGDEIVVGGFFGTAGGAPATSVARWTGSAWLAQSTPTFAWDFEVLALAALPNGDYFAGGTTSFFGLGGVFGGRDSNLARHRGGAASLQWDAADLVGEEVAAAVLLPDGDLVVGGSFDGAGGFASHEVALLRPTCPAAVVTQGAGCVGSGGPNTLVATALPWTGGAFRGRAAGMPAIAVAIAVTGFSTLAVPMPAVLPQGAAGCTLLVGPDLLDAALPIAGVVTTQVVLPDSPALAGQRFHHQVVPLELDAAGNLVAVTGTNGLALTIGVL